ncbi:hypothetical protein Rmet_6030 (plasmid) [Cupriavidus metallidurans CH34]|uniref:Uncharacterized protein n=1 Tax=Cupriavidus metallidurans (strain ATCC 43123 / DSM 2839 / NBRC 102507 / CH34) TaxID=266264 RepID=Q1LAD7_CUPMC|nr:hypothetical protein Rmet_6030 [Cupriavidus metallidurans CH34]
MRQVTQADFLARALEVHGDRYDYSRAIYSGSNSKLTIVCRTHGPFEQTPSNHYKGKGCRACAGVQPYTLQSFVDRARSLHGDRYGYAEASLVNALTPLTIRCSVHGPFEQTPRRHLSGSGCPKCAITLGADRQRGTADSFIAKAHSVHGERYDYSRVAYAATHTKVVIVCPEHGPFEQTPAAHQRGAGCPACAGVARLDTSSFVARARAIHGQRFGYPAATANLSSTSRPICFTVGRNAWSGLRVCSTGSPEEARAIASASSFVDASVTAGSEARAATAMWAQTARMLILFICMGRASRHSTFLPIRATLRGQGNLQDVCGARACASRLNC